MEKNINMSELKFNTEIYNKRAIREALSAFRPVAILEAKNYKRYIRIRIEPLDKNKCSSVADEFANYVLGMTKKCF